jgi:hypothetical protein
MKYALDVETRAEQELRFEGVSEADGTYPCRAVRGIRSKPSWDQRGSRVDPAGELKAVGRGAVDIRKILRSTLRARRARHTMASAPVSYAANRFHRKVKPSALDIGLSSNRPRCQQRASHYCEDSL